MQNAEHDDATAVAGSIRGCFVRRRRRDPRRRRSGFVVDVVVAAVVCASA